MFSKDIMGLLIEVLKSWQVIVMAVAIILYMSIVIYAARAYHRPRASKAKAKKKKANSAAPAEVVSSGSDVNSELGLEEN